MGEGGCEGVEVGIGASGEDEVEGGVSVKVVVTIEPSVLLEVLREVVVNGES